MTTTPRPNPTPANAAIPTWKLTGLLIRSQWKPFALNFGFTLLIFAEQLVPGLIAKAIFDGLAGQGAALDGSQAFLWAMFALYIGIELARLFVAIGYDYYDWTYRLLTGSLRVSGLMGEVS